MSYGAATGAAGVVAMAAATNAIKAFGTIVRVEPDVFAELVSRNPDALVVCAEGGIFSTKYRYLTGYKGLAFWTKASSPLEFSTEAELIMAKKISIPDI